MSKILFGDRVVDQRGKLGGVVYAKNKGGNYIRTKITPTNPQTAAQMSMRQQLGSASSAWRSLTAPERASWINAAPSFPVINVFGQVKQLSGFGLFVQLSKNLALVGSSAPTTAPAPIAIPPIDISILTADASAHTIAISFANAVPGDTFTFVVCATPQLGAGIYFVKNKYRVVRLISGDTVSPLAIGTQYEAMFGTLTADLKIGVRMYLISNDTGQMGVPVTAMTTIVP